MSRLIQYITVGVYRCTGAGLDTVSFKFGSTFAAKTSDNVNTCRVAMADSNSKKTFVYI